MYGQPIYFPFLLLKQTWTSKLMLRKVTLGLPAPQQTLFYRFLSLVPPGRISISQQVDQSCTCDCVTLDGVDYIVRIIGSQTRDELDTAFLQPGEFLNVFTNVHRLFRVLEDNKPGFYRRSNRGTGNFDIAIIDVSNSDDLDFVNDVLRAHNSKTKGWEKKVILIAPSLNCCRHVIFKNFQFSKLEYSVARGGTTGVCQVHGKRNLLFSDRLFTNINISKIPSPQEAGYFYLLHIIYYCYIYLTLYFRYMLCLICNEWMNWPSAHCYECGKCHMQGFRRWRSCPFASAQPPPPPLTSPSLTPSPTPPPPQPPSPPQPSSSFSLQPPPPSPQTGKRGPSPPGNAPDPPRSFEESMQQILASEIAAAPESEAKIKADMLSVEQFLLSGVVQRAELGNEYFCSFFHFYLFI
jgi:hypothetical protein